MGDRIRAFDWSKTPLGSPATWPEALRASLGICLNTSFPIAVYFGPEGILLYNDAWHPILGDKHPWALGRSGREVWSEIWDVVGPVFERVMATGEGSFFKDALLSMHRFGYTEECYFDYTFSPIRGQSGKIEGVFNAVTEMTFRVIGDRRSELLRKLAARVATAEQEADVCTSAIEVLEGDPADVPFALLYLLDRSESRATLVGRVGVTEASPAAPAEADLARNGNDVWPLATAVRTAQAQRVDLRPERFGALPGGPWQERTAEAIVVPVAATGRGGTAAVLVLGVSPRRALDEAYRDFLLLIATQVGAAIANARTHQEERERAKALADLDRAKTEFFSNISHEFRTPLTLMLGPVEDLLEKSYTDLTPATKNQLEIVHRNSLRLMKLVNTMLDFSRIEAGREEANFMAVDLAAFTTELASVFRAAIERAGLKLIVSCSPLPEAVLIDRDMWEKVVLNLLSNAFKFTLAGEIEVRLEAAGREARLTVRDTGVGIPAPEIPRLFERFHRVKESRGRTHEGTGIGLALVQELVRLHGGTVRVESVLDQGSSFIVTVPLGRAHLDPRRIRGLPERAPGNLAAAAFVKEAMRWTAGEEPPTEQAWARASHEALGPGREAGAGERSAVARPLLVLADDNADMRDYVKRLLEERFEVTAVADGQAALDAIRAAPPELVLSDVMMPRLDGFGLLRALRADPGLNSIPIILLSARAGEEARVEGVASGADDYLVKPFSSRELLARVESHVRMAQFRRESQEALRESETRLRRANTELADRLGELQRATTEISDSRRSAVALMESAVQARAEVEKLNHELRAEIAEREEAHRRLRQRTAQFETLLNRAPLGMYVVDSNFRLRDVNPAALPGFGAIPDLVGRDFGAVLRTLWAEARADEIARRFRHTLETGESYAVPEFSEERIDRDATEFYDWRIDRIPLPDGTNGVVCYFRDISEQVKARLALKGARDDAMAANRAKDEFLATLSHELRTPLNPVLLVASSSADDPSLPDEIRRDFKMIADNVSLQARLIDDLLDFNRIIHGKIALERRALDLFAIVRDATTTIRGEINAKRLQLELALSEPSPLVEGDPVRLRQVFWNLLKNALKFTPAGGVIEVSCCGGTMGIAEIRIRDTGIGLSGEELARIFDPFVQGRHADGKNHAEFAGLGLGLAISRMLVECHGGTITAESPGPGGGSTFVVRLPHKRPAGRPPGRTEGGPANGSQPPLARPERPAHRLLFVEDHEPTRIALTRLLERRGYAVTAVRTAEEAVQRAAQAHFDVLISDLGLPDGDGCDLMRQLRLRQASLQGIAVSGFGMDTDVSRSRAAGFREHLTKPVSIESIDRALVRLMPTSGSGVGT